MDIALRLTILNGMLFASILFMTSEEPASVPLFFQKVWRRYRIYREMRRKRAMERPANDFWEIDMTNFEP